MDPAWWNSSVVVVMKVLDLQCENQHVFEGWFSSEIDFQDQQGCGLVECPVCGNASVVKMLSAPRLNLAGGRENSQPSQTSQDVACATGAEPSMQAAWTALAQRIVASTDDVGEQFAEEARKIHYGEAQVRGIRGKASLAETQALIEEGVAIMPLALPEFLKGQLQ